ncbi:hypothetical protein AnigIFM50267_003344 [Aspergillus niger]|nr:hypothetical protein AnigIFM50267_003344 [Aspergillus niger]
MPNSGCHQDKSPMNCESCKRRHEKCDKSLPQWYAFPRSTVHGAESVNQRSGRCIERSVSCNYTNTAVIEEGPKYWRPIRPEMNYLPLNKLIDLITKLYESLEQRGMRDYTIWAQKLPLSSWLALWTGLKSVFYSMPQEWRYESELAKFLETEQYLQTLDSSSIVSCQFNNKNLSGLADTITVLRHIQRQLVHIKKHYNQVNKLVDFLDKFLGDICSLSPDQAFQHVHILRQWLFWLPPVMLRDGVDDTIGLAVLAQFFAVGLNLHCLFPELGCHDLGPLAVGPIKEIDRTVRARNMAKPHDPNVQLAMYLMGMPQSIATKWQERLIADESAVGL